MTRLLILFLLSARVVTGEIILTGDIDVIRQYLDGADETTLVTFDVDEVLIVPSDRILRPAARAVNSPLFHDVIYRQDDSQREKTFSKWIGQVQVELVHPDLPEMILALQERGVHTMGCTRMIPGMGQCGEIDRLEDFRFREVFDQGIDFRGTFSLLKSISLQSFAPKNGRIPGFKDGILYAQPYPKGPVLRAFLNAVRFRPQRVIFLDDSLHNLESVGKAMADIGVEFLGIHYLEDRLANESFDEGLGRFQFEFFGEHGVWLSDIQARAHLENAD
jgi:hypothetical protein